MSIRHPLRKYQLEIGRAVSESVFDRKGLTFTVEIARQGGKNELSAQLATYFLTMSMVRGGNMIKAAPTFLPQCLISMNRLKEQLNEANFGGRWHTEAGNTIVLGNARQIFLSAEPHANVVGNTAHILLEMDEAQDIASEKYHKEFRPMGASTNVTTVLYGTPWDGHSLLEEVAESNLELERKDGVKRHFSVPWDEVAKHSPPYRSYVESERERMGENHPLFRTQYLLLPVSGRGGLFAAGDTAQLQGAHPRLRGPIRDAIYVAGLDVGGGIDDLSISDRRPDSTVLTIGELDFSTADTINRDPAVRVVEHYEWQGIPHHALYPRTGGHPEERVALPPRRRRRHRHGRRRRQRVDESPRLQRGDVPAIQRPEQVPAGLRPAVGGQLRPPEDVRPRRLRRVGRILAADDVGAGPVPDGQDHELLRRRIPGPRRLPQQPGPTGRSRQIPPPRGHRPPPPPRPPAGPRLTQP